MDWRRPRSTDGGPSPPYFPIEKKFCAGKSPLILQLAPCPFVKSSHSPRKFQEGPWFSKINSSLALATFQKLQKVAATSFRHIFATVTPISVILAPKFSESLPLSYYAFINICLLHID
jgi:hypothetical protein